MKNIIRVKKETGYVVIDKTFLGDDRLSWKAKGIMAYMLSMPDDWTFYIDELAKHSTDGKSSFRSGFNELKKAGYVRRNKHRQEDGTFKWETVVYEKPLTDFSQVDIPQVDIPQVDNRTLLSNDELNNNKLNNNNIYTDEFELFWKEYPRKVEKKRAYKSFKTAIKKHSLDTILRGTKGYVYSIKKEGTETKFIKHASTFLNNESFNDFLHERDLAKPKVATKTKEQLEHERMIKQLYGG